MKAALAASILLLAACGGTATVKAGADPDYEKLFKAATFTLPEAIDRALAVSEAKGCVVVSAEIEEENGKIIYSMELATAGARILVVAANLATAEGARELRDRTLAEFSTVHVLVNNVGI